MIVTTVKPTFYSYQICPKHPYLKCTTEATLHVSAARVETKTSRALLGYGTKMVGFLVARPVAMKARLTIRGPRPVD